MQKIKSFIYNSVNANMKYVLEKILKYYRYTKNIFKTILFSIKFIFLFRVPGKKLNNGLKFRKVLNKVRIKINKNYNLFYNIDFYTLRSHENIVIDNITIDYEKILNNSIKDFWIAIDKIKNNNYKEEQRNTLLGIEEYINRICKKLTKSKCRNRDNIIRYLYNIKSGYPSSFEEALQRILFWNMILWQEGHSLNGLGRLDKILNKYYMDDIKNKKITKKYAKELLTEFCKILHSDYFFKSNVLMGDTGQIIILGGKEDDVTYFYNDLTYIFIDIIKELQIPDPKLFLRVSKNMPKNLIEKSLECIKTGIGSPLFSNDERIIPALIDYGIPEEDAYNYATSACWEPFVAGKSIEQNNIDSLVFIKPLNEMFNREKANRFTNFNEIIEVYKTYLSDYIKNFIININKIKWEKSPLLSLLTSNCIERELDITSGGCIYNNYGLTSTSLGNTINSLYNIKKLVFQEKKISLNNLVDACKNNYDDNENILKLLKNQDTRYGTDDEEVINLTNDITLFASEELKKYKNAIGGKYKFGLSSPGYITKANDVSASLDGRMNGDPFLVHISSDKNQLSYTELINFSSKLNYDNGRINGNVVDFIITPSFIEDNFDKMVNFIILSIENGFYQMQMNVLSSDILIKAKNDPKAVPNLIVRVWGFSSYFNDLPSEYKDLLIERAILNERKNN